jgi:hypothetical protein
MSSKDQDAYTEPAFVPRSVVPQKFETPDEYLSFLKENELTSIDPSIAPGNNGLAKRNEITDKLKELHSYDPRARGKNDISRTIYFWDFSTDSVPNVPQILTRSKVLISDYSYKPSPVDHAVAIKLITCKPKRAAVQQSVAAQQQVQVESVSEDDEDIFADAGRDYVLEVDASYQSVTVDIQEDEEEEQIDLDMERQEFILEEGNGKKRASEMVDTDMMDLDLEEIEFSNLGESLNHQKKKLKTRSDFASEEAWRSYEEAQSLMLSSGRMASLEDKTRRGRGGYRASTRGSQRGGRGAKVSGKKGDKLDRELEAVDKVYQKKYGSGLK